MNFALSKDFLDSLASLEGNEIKKANKTVRDIYNKSDSNGLRFHQINHPCGKIVSYSVNMDIRIIAYKSDNNIILLYIDHHDDAYNWIQKRTILCSPNQDVRIVTSSGDSTPLAHEAIVPYVGKKIVRSEITPEMFEALRNMESEEELVDYIDDQPREIQEELFNFAVNAFKAQSCSVSHNFSVKVITDDKILEEALNFPLKQWRIFLHPKQEEAINVPIASSSLITGAPGTGKTVCLIHKAKRMEKEIGPKECILITTFKKTLQNYLLEMLTDLSYDSEKIFIVDISLLNQIKDASLTENLDGFFRWQKKILYYYRKNKRYKVRHVFFDEYQDFSKGAVSAIRNIIETVPYTICYDYSQSIYKPILRTTDLLENENIDKFSLNYSYRVNSRILEKLKRIMHMISMLSTEDMIQGGVTKEENMIIQSTESAIEGSDIKMIPYSDNGEKNLVIESEYNLFRNTYQSDDIVVTSFIPDFFCNLQQDDNFRAADMPLSVQSSYHYLPTLKGKEYKAGIIVLDEVVSQLLNMNRILFNKVDGSVKSPKQNVRFYVNLLYVALSRFRDYVTILYPSRYKETVTSILE